MDEVVCPSGSWLHPSREFIYDIVIAEDGISIEV